MSSSGLGYSEGCGRGVRSHTPAARRPSLESRRMAGLARNALQIQIAKMAQIGSALIASMLLARAVGPTGLGEYALALALAVLLQGLFSFGFEDLVLARGPRAGGDTPDALSLYRQALRGRVAAAAALLTVAGASFVLLGDAAFGFSTSSVVPLIFAYAALNGVATLGAAVQACRRRAGGTSALDATWAVLVTATYGVLFYSGELTTERALLALVAAQALVTIGYAVILLPLVRSEARGARFSGREASVFWANGLLSIGVGKTSDVLAMRAAGAPKSDVGLFNAAFSANLTASSVLVQGAGTMAYVGLGSVFGRQDRSAIADAWRTAVALTAFLSFPLIALCVAAPGLVLSVLFGPEFDGAQWPLVALSLLTVVARTTGGGANQALLFLSERQGLVVRIRLACVFANIVLDVVAYQLFGLVGVAIASGVTGVLISIVEFRFAREGIPLRVPWGLGVRCLVPYLVPAFLGNLLVGTPDGLIAQLALGAGVLIVGTVLLPAAKPLAGVALPSGIPSGVRRLTGAQA